MELMQAIRHRRAIRAYEDRPLDRATVEALIEAAIQAPSAMNSQPWAFYVVQNRELLKSWSDRAKVVFLAEAPPTRMPDPYRQILTDPAFNIFYDAPTLILICAKPGGMVPAEDCSLAGQTLMLAAHGMGLGTCPIGFARAWLNRPEIKLELGIPAAYQPVLPIIVGHPREAPEPRERKAPEILAWR